MCKVFQTLGDRLCNQKSWLVIAIRKKIIKAKNPNAWNGNWETELNCVFEVKSDTNGFVLLNA